MQLCRFTSADQPAPRAGILRGDTVEVIPDVFTHVPTGTVLPRADVRLCAPVLPGKVVGVGLNYRAHALEMNKPLPPVPRLFIKPGTSVIGPGEDIILPRGSSRVDHEAQLAVVLGRTARRLTAHNALEHVLGFTCANDVTARDFQQEDVQFTRAKGFDSFCPLGPVITTGLDARALRVQGTVNGKVRQDGSTSDMIYGVVDLLVFITGIMTLLPGDIISTGTPAGVGPLVAGDTVEITVEGVGTLRNRVVAEPA